MSLKWNRYQCEMSVLTTRKMSIGSKSSDDNAEQDTSVSHNSTHI